MPVFTRKVLIGLLLGILSGAGSCFAVLSDAEAVLLDGRPFFPVGVYNYPMQVITNSSQPYTGIYYSRTVGDHDVNHLAELSTAFNVIVLDDHGQDIEPANTCTPEDIRQCARYGLAVIKSYDCSGDYGPAWLAQTNQLQTGSPLYNSLKSTLHEKNLLWIETKDEASFGDDPSRLYPGTPWPTYGQFASVNLFIHNTETNHLLWFNDGNYLGDGSSGRIAQLQKWGQWCDIYSEDLYPLFTDATSGDVGEPAANLDWVRSQIAPTQPNFMILQGSGGSQNGYDPTNGLCASYLQTRCMAWDSIIHGARGVLWWGAYFLDRNGSDWANFKSAGRELTWFAPMLAKHNLTACAYFNSASNAWQTSGMSLLVANQNIDLACFEYGGNHWLVAANHDYSSHSFMIGSISSWNAAGPNLNNAFITLAPLEVRIWADQTASTNFIPFPGGFVSAFNDTSTNFVYTGSWGYDSSRGFGDRQDDVHYTVTDGDFATFTFSGIGVDFITETYIDEGHAAVYVDDISNATVNCFSTNRLGQQMVFGVRNLSPGTHTLKLVKLAGPDMLVDGCFVYNAQIPATPTNFTAEARGKFISLSWPADEFASGFNLYRSTVSGGEGVAPYRTNLIWPSFTDTNVTAGTTYFYTVAAVNAAGVSAPSAEADATPSSATDYRDRILADSPRAYYPMDEMNGTTAYDLSGNHNNGIYSNAPATGIVGPSAYIPFAANFNGTNQWIGLDNPAILNFTGAISLEAWIQPTGFEPTFADILGHGYDNITAHETALRLNGSSSYYCGVYPGDNVSAGDPSMTIGQWAHVVGTYDRTNWNIYVNGVLVGSVPSANSGALNANSGWAIANGTDFSAGRYFQGGICQAAIYNYALTPSQIRAHYFTGLGGGKLNVALSGTNVVLSWPGGTLQQSDTVTGNYSVVTNAVSPWTIPAGATQKFFRIQF